MKALMKTPLPPSLLHSSLSKRIDFLFKLYFEIAYGVAESVLLKNIEADVFERIEWVTRTNRSMQQFSEYLLTWRSRYDWAPLASRPRHERTSSTLPATKAFYRSLRVQVLCMQCLRANRAPPRYPWEGSTMLYASTPNHGGTRISCPTMRKNGTFVSFK